ncbi:SAV_915 family protein [Lapillicoccus jejuensis]|uniref:Type III secretion system (T3SS) SseB-like protein n=1 Tax=Lapillicoccus jejuensis TaxID=402171 RepID=A0A542DYD0_9MICO|nr:type III secretion system (T3SS) SseB-like protein [Lapillicoccus jejuensis]
MPTVPTDVDPRVAGGLHVPVNPSRAGVTLRILRTPTGRPTVVAFTTVERLSAVLGEGQASVRLHERALRALAAPLGISTLVVDPVLLRPLPAAASPASPARRAPRQPVDGDRGVAVRSPASAAVRIGG